MGHCQRVLRVALHAQMQRLSTLQQQERIEGRQASPRIAEPLNTRLKSECQGTERLRIRDSVIRRIGAGEVWKATRCLPIKTARVNNDAADRSAVSADELRRRVNSNVCAPFDGPAKRRRWGSVVNNQWHAFLVSDFGETFDVQHIQFWIADCFRIDRSGLVIDRRAQAIVVGRVNKTHVDSESWQRVVEKIVRASVKGGGRKDLISGLCQSKNGKGICCLPRCETECRRATFKGSDALFKYIGRRIHDARVDVAKLLQREETSGMVRIIEDIRSCLIDGNGPRV